MVYVLAVVGPNTPNADFCGYVLVVVVEGVVLVVSLAANREAAPLAAPNNPVASGFYSGLVLVLSAGILMLVLLLDCEDTPWLNIMAACLVSCERSFFSGTYVYFVFLIWMPVDGYFITYWDFGKLILADTVGNLDTFLAISGINSSPSNEDPFYYPSLLDNYYDWSNFIDFTVADGFICYCGMGLGLGCYLLPPLIIGMLKGVLIKGLFFSDGCDYYLFKGIR